MTERLVALPDGTRLWTTTAGSGPTTVLCHGGPGLWDHLPDLAVLLQDAVSVVRFEQRGCGRSGGADGPFTVAQAVDDLDQLRHALGVDRWTVVGHSWGAELALRYAAAHPERTTAVGYVAGTGAGETWRAPYEQERDRRLGRDLPRWRELRGRPRTAAEEREWCLPQWRPDSSPAGDPAGDAEAMWRTRPGAAVVDAAARALIADPAAEDLLDVARRVRAPVTMVLGADDPRPWAATDDLLAALPGARRTVLSGAGHAPWRERPDDVRALLLQPYASASPTASSTP